MLSDPTCANRWKKKLRWSREAMHLEPNGSENDNGERPVTSKNRLNGAIDSAKIRQQVRNVFDLSAQRKKSGTPEGTCDRRRRFALLYEGLLPFLLSQFFHGKPKRNRPPVREAFKGLISSWNLVAGAGFGLWRTRQLIQRPI
jgi:hypothetical protein